MLPRERKTLEEIAWQHDPSMFARRASGGQFKRHRWIADLSRRIRKPMFKGGGRFVITAPPQHGKSFFVSYWLVIWYLVHFPEHRVMIISYSSDLAVAASLYIRRFFEQHPEYGIGVDQSQGTKDDWYTTKGGGVLAAGVKGSITGKPCHVMILDDTIKGPEQATSPSYRQYLIDLWKSTLTSRFQSKSSVICMHTRWHFKDLAGYLLSDESGEDFTELRYPAFAEANDLCGREEGETLCPSLHSQEDMQKRMDICGGEDSRWWLSIYQQKPGAEGGDIIREKDLRFWYRGQAPDPWTCVDNKGELVECVQEELPPMFDGLITSWDCAFKGKKTSDNVSGQVWAYEKAKRYLLDRINKKMGFRETKNNVKLMDDRWPGATAHLIEDKANGPAILDELSEDIEGMLPVEPRGGKEARLESVSPLTASGCVYLPHPRMPGYAWVQAVINEIVNFGTWDTDDDADAFSQALAWIRHKGREDRENEWSGLY